MKQRQPVLLALIPPAAADRLIQRIIAGGAAEQLNVALPEQGRWRVSKGNLAHRHQRKFLHRLGGALRLRVEGLDAFEIVAEKIETHRIDAAWRK